MSGFAPLQPDAAAGRHASPCVVIDTNAVLDLFLFNDAQAQALHHAIVQCRVNWLALTGMRNELVRVLDDPHIVRQASRRAVPVRQVLAAFDRWATLTSAPAPAPYRCRDADDQPFIDLAFACRATLFSKDRAVLGLARRLAGHGVHVSTIAAWCVERRA